LADGNNEKETFGPMVKKTILILFTVLGLAAVASAKSYSLMLFEPSYIGTTVLKPGTYTLELKQDKVVIRRGKQVAEAPAKTETADNKYPSTTVRYQNGDGKYHIREIHLGGTNIRVMVTAE
jgi:hypothetical protein